MLRRVLQALFCKQISFLFIASASGCYYRCSNDDEEKLPRLIWLSTSDVLQRSRHRALIAENSSETLPKYTSTMAMTSSPAAPAFALFTLMVPTPPRIFNTFWLHFYELAGRKTQTENHLRDIFIGVFTFSSFGFPENLSLNCLQLCTSMIRASERERETRSVPMRLAPAGTTRDVICQCTGEPRNKAKVLMFCLFIHTLHAHSEPKT